MAISHGLVPCSIISPTVAHFKLQIAYLPILFSFSLNITSNSTKLKLKINLQKDVCIVICEWLLLLVTNYYTTVSYILVYEDEPLFLYELWLWFSVTIGTKYGKLIRFCLLQFLFLVITTLFMILVTDDDE